MLPSLVIIDEAAGHGYYVGPINKTVTVLGCCGPSRTSINVKVARRYYAPYQSQYSLALWGYHWHKSEQTNCVDRNNQHYDDKCDTRRWVCIEYRADEPYAECEIGTEGYRDCYDNATNAYDEYLILTYNGIDHFYEVTEECGWQIVP